MSTQKRKFELFSRLQKLGFTYDESAQLRRIEMTLSRWSEAECNGEIERNEETGKPERVSRCYLSGYSSKRVAWPCADREAGALRRLKAIVDGRNARHSSDDVLPYHQGDPRGCSLYLVKRSDLLPQAQTHAEAVKILDQYYTRGLAVCA